MYLRLEYELIANPGNCLFDHLPRRIVCGWWGGGVMGKASIIPYVTQGEERKKPGIHTIHACIIID